MKKRNRSILLIMLSLMLVIALCLGTAATAFAQEESHEELVTAINSQAAQTGAFNLKSLDGTYTAPSGSRLDSVVDINSSAAPDIYVTNQDTKYTSYNYSVYMPAKGTLEIVYYCSDDDLSDAYYSSSDMEYGRQYTAAGSDGTVYGYKTFYAAAAGWHTLSLSNSAPATGNAIAFKLYYAPASSKTLKATSKKQTYIFGNAGDNKTETTFKITVPAKGYLTLNMGEYGGTSSVYFKTSGFKGYEYLSSTDAERYIGVKKGTYTIKVKGYASMDGVVYKFTKIKEGKFGTKKANAAKLTKKKVRKGVIVTNKKQTHWYKIVNPKLQKVTLVVNGNKSVGGGNYGGFKVTVYDKKGSMGSRTLTHGSSKGEYSLYTFGKNNKLVAGTYWIKVQSYNSGSGYFTVKWK